MTDRKDDRGRPESSFAGELSRAISARRVTLRYLSQWLSAAGTPVSVSALSSWRSGDRQPEHAKSLAALPSLEQLLRLPDGALTRRVGPPRRRGPVLQANAIATMMLPFNEHTMAGLEALGFSHDLGLHETSTHHIVTVDETGSVRRIQFRTLLRAVRSGVDRRPIVLTSSWPGEDDKTSFEVLAGGRLGRTYTDTEHGCYVAELIFHRALEAGEYVLTEHEVVVAPSIRMFCQCYMVRQMRQAIVTVRFHPDHRPKAVETYTDLHAGLVFKNFPMRGGNEAIVCVHGAGPGKLGVRWTWDGEMPSVL